MLHAIKFTCSVCSSVTVTIGPIVLLLQHHLKPGGKMYRRKHPCWAESDDTLVVWEREQDFLSVLLQLWLDWGMGEGTQLTPGTRASIDHYPSIIIERVSRCKNRFKFCTHKASNAQFYWKFISNLIRPHCWCWKLMMFIFLFKIDLQKKPCMMSRTSELSV